MPLSHMQPPTNTTSSQRLGVAGARQGISKLATDVRIPAVAFLAHLAVVLTFATVAASRESRLPAVPAAGFFLQPLDNALAVVLEPLFHWDGYWYTLIADRGYEVHPATTAFWPLYPLLLKLGNSLFAWPIPVLGIVVSNVAFLAALVVLYRLVRLDYGGQIAGRATWLLTLFPTAFFFSALYTESLFLLLTVSAIYCARTDRWGRAGTLGVLAAISRNSGVLVMIPLGILLIERYGWNPRNWWTRGLQIAMIAAGPLIYFGYLQLTWGDPLLTVHVQSQWARYQAMPWDTLSAAFAQLDLTWTRWLRAYPTWDMLSSRFVRTSIAEGGIYDLLVTLLFIPIALYAARRVRLAYSLYALLIFVLPLFSPSHIHPLMSMPRFVIVLFPFFIAMAMLLRHGWLFRAVLVISTIQLAGLMIQFGTWYWVA